jgi:(p)ppGpp synthase/HD superfamily hydrolase
VTISLEGARAIARRAHDGQVDLLGVDYMEHVEAVAAGLVDFDLELQIAAMLHDVVEDSNLSLQDLRDEGVSERSLAAIALVSRNLHPDLTYAAAIELVAQSPDAVLVKISDNAHNSLPERVEALRVIGKEPKPRYAEARRVLYAAAKREDVERILQRANPSLLAELSPR